MSCPIDRLLSSPEGKTLEFERDLVNEKSSTEISLDQQGWQISKYCCVKRAQQKGREEE